METYLNQARNLRESHNNLKKEKKMWILVDEFNTSYLQPMLAELMNERTSTYSDLLKDVPDNVIFIGCCNPYMITEHKNTDL
jgi:hypothetical protein